MKLVTICQRPRPGGALVGAKVTEVSSQASETEIRRERQAVKK